MPTLMPHDLFTAFVAFAFVSSITPGPNNLMLMASGANYGFRRTVPHMLGITCGMGIMTLVLGAGVMPLFEAYPIIEKALTVLCVAYLLYLAWKVANATAPEGGQSEGKPFSFLQAAGFQWVNPKAWTMGLSAITLYAAGREFGAVIWLAGAFTTVSLISVSVWTIMGQQLRRFLSRPERLRVFNWSMALLLVGSLYPVIFGTH